jgi:hypothetical protein
MPKFHIPIKGRAIRVIGKKVVHKKSSGGMMCRDAHMRGAGNLQRLRDALEKLNLKEKKYVRF